ncbi:putative aldose 1-epimerase, partial [Aspergillus campestris IBT 28561]
FLPLGALIQRFRVGNRNIVLGYDSPDDYLQYGGPQFGKTIGRVSNRIENGIFELNDVDYHLPQTDGYRNTTDGGVRGWGMRTFQGPTKAERNDLDATLFTYRSEDGEEGFPGEVELKVWYMESHGRTATGKRTTVLIVEYEAELTSAEPESTVINVSNRSYFNLTDEPSIEGTKVNLCTRKYLPVDKRGIPIGEISDFSPDVTGEISLGADEPKIDHCFVTEDKGDRTMDTRSNELKTLGSFSKGNMHLKVQSTEPAFQFNTGDHLNSSENPRYGPRAGFYIEPCRYINAINSPEWRSMVILRQGEKYGYKNVYTAWE